MNFPSLPFRKEEPALMAASFAGKCRELYSGDILEKALSFIDLTTLNPTDTVSSVASLTHRVNSFQLEFPHLPHVSALCVYPNMVSVVKENLAVKGVAVASVAGNFPSSMTFRELKAEEARLAVLNGADEIDVVLPLWAFLEENYEWCLEEIKMIKTAVGDACLKVIIESGVLQDPEKIWRASVISLEGGADFIKTSTGKLPVSATPEAAVVMCHALKYWYEHTGEIRGFKPAGGIKDTASALIYISVVREILGDEWLNGSRFRIGASSLVNNLISDILNQKINYF